MNEDARREALRAEYVARVNRVMDHVELHLGRELSLTELARVAGFSRYHFHRIFRALTGEPLGRFIQRLRLEKAATRLKANLREAVTSIALDCGFSGPDTFARAFREAFGMTASEWRESGHEGRSNDGQTESKMRQMLRNGCQECRVTVHYGGDTTYAPTWRIEMSSKHSDGDRQLTAKVEVEEFPEMTVAYVRHVGPYAGDAELFKGLFEKLMGWAGPRGLLASPDLKCMAIYHDDPEVTDEENLRTSLCVTVPPDTEVDGEIGKMVIAAGAYARAHFDLLPDEYAAAWSAVMGGWLPESGYQPDDRPCFELFGGSPDDDPEGRHSVDICVPVKPL